ncbi:uncharacterized protein LOC108712739 isoform X1 [Xenopus laevis]|uniref:Interleukin-1 beta n=1 Tax=Xenopus laevis TaxID=8355 RepID=A0A8J0UPC8_XENLA|nr:uncharacterized protein LOC108712739 isoform X1 [Xenopus laevis]
MKSSMACNWVNGESLFSPWNQDSRDMLCPDNLGPPTYISYPIPPYGTLHQHGRKAIFPIMNRHKIIDMTKKFDLNDISYIYLDSFNLNQSMETLRPAPVSYRREYSRTYFIKDSNNKWFVFENGVLKAKYLQGDNFNNRATVTISKYSSLSGGKIPVTLKIEGPNIFLLCSSGSLQYEATNENLDTISDESKEKFLFYQNPIGTFTCSFEPTRNLQLTLCTDTSSNVNVQPKSSNTPNVHFSLFSPPSSRFVNVGGGRIALRPQGTEKLDNNFRWLLPNKCNPDYLF